MPDMVATRPNLAKCRGTRLMSSRLMPYMQPVMRVIIVILNTGRDW